MIRKSTILVSILILLLSVIANGSIQLHEEKLATIKREALQAADAVRYITITTPKNKLQISSMATDFILYLNYAIYTLNNVIPNLFNTKEQKALAAIVQSQSSIANDIQQCITDEPEELKEKLAESLEKLFVVYVQFEDNFKGKFNNFSNTQFNRNNNIVIYIISKVKFQATLFKKSNKELIAEMTKSNTEITKTLSSLPCLNQAVEDDFNRFLQLGSIMTERCTYKLQNWVEVNPHQAHDLKVVQEVAQVASELYEKEINAIDGKGEVSYIKGQIITLYQISLQLGIKVAQVEYPENLGGEEFLRDSLFDMVTHGRVHADNLCHILSKSCHHYDY